MLQDQIECKTGNPLPPVSGLLFSVNIVWHLVDHSWDTGWSGEKPSVSST